MKLPRTIEALPAMHDWCILSGYRGSLAQGMYVPSKDPTNASDVDVFSVAVLPEDFYIGLADQFNKYKFGTKGVIEIRRDEWDIVVYEFRKFIRLLCKGNPSMLTYLWVDPKHLIKQTPAGRLLREHRDLFTTKQVCHSFRGYAYGQLKKMTQAGGQGCAGDKRKALVAKHGYFPKNAAHLIRLLRMGIEFIQDGQLNVERHDATELLNIKHGCLELKEVEELAADLFEQAKEAESKCKFPNVVNCNRVNELAVDIVTTHMASLHDRYR